MNQYCLAVNEDDAVNQHYFNVFQDNHANEYEAELLEVVKQVQSGDLKSALELSEQHLQAYPKSSLGNMIKADILTAMSSGVTQYQDQDIIFRGLRHQLKNRWQHSLVDAAVSKSLPSSLLVMGQHKHVLIADMQAGRLYLYENSPQGPKLVRDYYMSVGSEGYGKQVEGDNKTPIGVYSINQYIDPKKLPDLYGDGAFPITYPNLIDKYRNRTGYGIWLHGTPSITYARSPFASEGCFVLSNQDLIDIAQFIDVDNKTPVILSEKIDWIDNEQLISKRDSYLGILNAWKSDWESLDISAYLSHYSKENFNLGKSDYSQFAQRKIATSKSKTFISIDLEIESLFVYPGEQDMFIVNFTQQYSSNNFSSDTHKQQYWQRDQSGQWRIIFEG